MAEPAEGPPPQGGDAAAGIPLRTSTGAMNPDHPMLQRAQQALARQLKAKRMRVEGELREKQTELQRAKKQREEVGVELYGFQQSLAKLQMSLEKAQGNYQSLSESRVQAEQEVAQLRERLQQEQSTNKHEEQRAEAVQRELDRLGATLRQIEAYNESMKGEIAVTRRAAYAAEEAMQKLEKEKQQQDYLIDDLQERMRSLEQQLALYTAQLTEQRHETRAAQETLAQAESDMEAVHFEKKQLLAQWKGSLTAIQRRDQALAAINESIVKQQQQELAIETEIQGYKKDILKEQIRNEQLSNTVHKVQGECEFVLKQASAAAEKQETLAAQLAKLTISLEQTEERIKKAMQESKALSNEATSVERTTQRLFQEVRALEADLLRTLSEATSAEKSSSKTAADIRALRAAAEEEDMLIAQVQNELARLAVDALNTQGHNDRLKQALQLLYAKLKDKDAAIAKSEVELKRRTDEIERRTRETDNLNRKLERLLAAQPEAINTGPLECTIHNLGKEIEHKTKDGQELQRRWIGKQTELVALQVENNALAEALTRQKAEVTVLSQKRARVEQALEAQAKESKALKVAAQRLQVDLGRINALVAQNAGLKAMLEGEHLQLEGRALSELRSLEETSASLSSSIQEGTLAKRQLLDDLLEAERQIMLSERKIQLEKEMQEMLDPTIGEGVVAAMRKEVHRMELRHAELQRVQERLMQTLEKALSKHEIIGVRALAQRMKAAGGAGGGSSRGSSPAGGGSGRSSPGAAHRGSTNGSGSPGQGSRVVQEFKRSIRDTEAEAAATAERLQQLQAEREHVQQQAAAAAGAWQQLQQQQEQLRSEAAAAAAARQQHLLATSQLQNMAKLWEDAAAGRYKRSVDPAAAAAAAAAASAVSASESGARGEAAAAAAPGSSKQLVLAELSKASQKQAKLVEALQGLQAQVPGMQDDLHRVLLHAAATTAWLPQAVPTI